VLATITLVRLAGDGRARRRANEAEELPVPFGVDTGMKVVRSPARDLDSGRHGGGVEIEQAGRQPAGQGCTSARSICRSTSRYRSNSSAASSISASDEMPYQLRPFVAAEA
jgi:hypothetical protein